MSEGGKSFKIILLAISVGWLPVFVSAVIQGYEENNKGIGLHYNTVFINILGVFCIIAGAAVAYFAKTYRNSAVINTNRNEVKERLILKGLMAMALIGGIFSYYRWKSIGIDPLSKLCPACCHGSWRHEPWHLKKPRFQCVNIGEQGILNYS
jgi:hypothetical protein